MSAANVEKAFAEQRSRDEQDAHLVFSTLLKKTTQGKSYEREILVALQFLDFVGYWPEIVAQIAAAPSTWRWWIRPHPNHAHRVTRGVTESGELYIDYKLTDCEETIRGHLDPPLAPRRSIDMANIVIVPSSIASHSSTMPRMVKHMDVLISLISSACREAAAVGVPSFFLHEVYRSRGTHSEGAPFWDLIDRGLAKFVSLRCINFEIERLRWTRGART